MAIKVIDWGVIDYLEAWEQQKELVAQVQSEQSDGYLVFCEHPSVITLGKNGSDENITKDLGFLANQGIKVIPNNRGGDVTLHNPGQQVGYPIINLNNFKRDLHWFLRTIENSIINTLKSYNIVADVYEGYTGVWIESERKIAAIGLHCSRWVTSHGFALNVQNDLSEFDYIIPCGIADKAVTSISNEISRLGRDGTSIDMTKLRDDLLKNFTSLMDDEKKHSDG